MSCECNKLHNSDNKIQNSDNGDLTIYNWGEQRCPPGHYYGPAIRDHYLIHYILDGKGHFHVGDKTYNLKKGDGFLICPNVVTFYHADPEKPWHYAWAGFYGIKSKYYLEMANLSLDNPIFSYNKDEYLKDCLLEMANIDGFSDHDEVHLTGLLYIFMAKLIEIGSEHSSNAGLKDQKRLYVKKAVQYIERNYARTLTISQISHYIGIDRKYLCQLFKQYLNTTPQQFLIDYRMDKAAYLLLNTSLYIGDIARSVGYEDPLQFSKIFKKVKGVSPKHYRENKK